MHKALILVNGFEGILSRVAEIAKKDYGIDYFEFVYLLSMNHENSQGISGLAQEIEFIDRKARQCAVDFKNIFMTFKKLLTGIRSLKHDFYVISSEGDKQFLLLPILLILKRMPKRFIYFDLMRAEASDLTLLMLAGNIFRRLLNRNALNLFLSRISKKFRLKRVFGYPDNFMIEPTNLCNLRCQVCLTGLDKLQRKKGKIDKQVFFKIMDECGSYIRHLNMHFMGESFLHGGIIDMIIYAKKKGVELIEISTNGNLDFDDKYIEAIVNSGLHILVFSVDGADQETYEKDRKGGKLDAVLGNIKRISEFRNAKNSFYPKLIVQFIIMKHNIAQLDAMRQITRSCGADGIRVKSLNIKMGDGDAGKIRYFLAGKEILAACDSSIKQILSGNARKGICSNPWDSIVITWDGDVLPCCRDFDGELKLGNVLKDGVKKVWNNENYVSLRKQMTKDMSKMKLCNNCSPQYD